MQEAIRKGHIHLESNRKSDPIGDPSGPDGPDDRVCKGRAQCGLFVLPRPLQKHPVGHFLRVRADAHRAVGGAGSPAGAVVFLYAHPRVHGTPEPALLAVRRSRTDSGQ